MDPLTRQLCQFPIFQGVSTAALRELVATCDVLQFQTRDQVLSQGGASDVAYLVVDGMLEVSVQTERTWHHIAEIHPGDVVGESALYVYGVSRNATVFAHRDTHCLVLRPANLRQLTNNEAVVALEVSLIASLSRRIRKTNVEIQSAWKEQAPAAGSKSTEEMAPTTIAARLRRLFRGRNPS